MNVWMRRVLAFMTDYCVMAAYAMILWAVASLVIQQGNTDATNISPVKGQLIGFFTLTLPVTLYFIISENGKRHATLGKRLVKIAVAGTGNSKPSVKSVIVRNVLKFLPWEMAHTGIHRIRQYGENNDIPLWIWLLLTIPQFMMVIYFFSIVADKNGRSLYDKAAGTVVIPVEIRPNKFPDV